MSQNNLTTSQVLANLLKRLPDEDGINLTPRDETDRQYLYVESARLANQQEDFYKHNDGWAPMTKEQLVAEAFSL